MMKMPLCGVCVMCRRFVVSRFVVLRSLAMMMGRVVVVFGSFVMMFCSLFGHLSS
jgi:hypothetical protein